MYGRLLNGSYRVVLTPFSSAYNEGDSDLVRILLGEAAWTDAHEKRAWRRRISFPALGEPHPRPLGPLTPLHVAARWGKRNAVAALLAAGGSQPERAGPIRESTPLYGDCVAFCPDPARAEIVRLLLEAGGDPNTANEDGYSAIAQAALTQDTEVLQLLRAHGGGSGGRRPCGRAEHCHDRRVQGDLCALPGSGRLHQRRLSNDDRREAERPRRFFLSSQ